MSYESMNAEPDGTVIGYMCLIDWECELGAASDGNRVYPSIESLKREHKCWKSCGIAKVRVSFIEAWPATKGPMSELTGGDIPL